MKKKKNIWLIIFCLLVLGITVIALIGEGSLMINPNKASEEVGMVEKALGFLSNVSQPLALN